MSESDSNNNPSKRVPTGVALPFPTGPVLAIAPPVVIFLIFGWVYFSGTVQLNLGIRELKNKNQEAKAIDYFNWAISSNPSLAEAFAQRAKAKVKLEQRKGLKADYASAKSDIIRAIKFAPKNYAYYETSAEIDQASHNFRAAMTGYARLIDLKLPQLENHLNKHARLAYIVGDFDSERADREQVVQINTAQLNNHTQGDERPLERRALQNVFLGETDKALSDYESCFSSDQNPGDLLQMGFLHESSGRPAKAIEMYSKQIGLARKDADAQTAEAYSRRARLYLQAGENQKALADADQLLKYFNNDVNHAFHAKVLDALHRDTAAQAERKAAISHLSFAVDDVFKDAPNDVLASNYIERARFYAADEQWKKALRDYSVAVSLYPESTSYIGCAQMYTKLGDYDKAIEFFGKAITPSSSDSERETAYSQLGKVHLLQEKPELTMIDCGKAIAQNGESGAGSYWRAKAYRELGKNDLAKIDEQEALGLGFSENSGTIY